MSRQHQRKWLLCQFTLQACSARCAKHSISLTGQVTAAGQTAALSFNSQCALRLSLSTPCCCEDRQQPQLRCLLSCSVIPRRSVPRPLLVRLACTRHYCICERSSSVSMVAQYRQEHCACHQTATRVAPAPDQHFAKVPRKLAVNVFLCARQLHVTNSLTTVEQCAINSNAGMAKQSTTCRFM